MNPPCKIYKATFTVMVDNDNEPKPVKRTKYFFYEDIALTYLINCIRLRAHNAYFHYQCMYEKNPDDPPEEKLWYYFVKELERVETLYELQQLLTFRFSQHYRVDITQITLHVQRRIFIPEPPLNADEIPNKRIEQEVSDCEEQQQIDDDIEAEKEAREERKDKYRVVITQMNLDMREQEEAQEEDEAREEREDKKKQKV